jgi:endonuclease/exonuclease/phosphatase family metal-dependent hydrolase
MQTPTYEKFDRILVSTEWELKFPKVIAHTLARGISYHTPLLLDIGSSPQHNTCMFKFELA